MFSIVVITINLFSTYTDILALYILYTPTCTHSDAQIHDTLVVNPSMIPILEKVIGEFKAPMNVTILVIGDIGVGKSSLINRNEFSKNGSQCGQEKF